MKLKRVHLLFLGAVLGITVLYFFLRLTNILSLPLFTDEAIYTRWAQIAKQDASWRFISLVDGKQPMPIWVGMIILRFFTDPLLAMRIVSVFAGFGTVVGLFFLGNEVFRKKEKSYKIFSFTNASVSIGLLSSFIYVIYPFGLVYDRMALYDSMVGMFAVWSIYILIVLVRSLRLDIALISGIIIGGGLLTKTSAFFSLASMPLLLVIFDWSKKNLKEKLIKFIVFMIVVAVVSNVMYGVLRLSPFYHVIAEKNALFAYPLGEWLKSPFAYFYKNFTALTNWLLIYMTVPGIILIIASFFVKRDNFHEKALLVMWFLFPITYFTFFGNQIYPRHILFMTLSLIPLIAYSVYQLIEHYKNVLIRVAVLILAFGWFIYADFFIVYNFGNAPIPRADTGQYVNGWAAGNGVRQSVEFFNKEAKDKKIFIATEGTFGLMPYGLEMYLVSNPNIKIEGVWPITDEPPEDIYLKIKKMPTYAVFYQPCSSCEKTGAIPGGWHSHLIAQYKQGNDDSYYSIYRLLP